MDPVDLLIHTTRPRNDSANASMRKVGRVARRDTVQPRLFEILTVQKLRTDASGILRLTQDGKIVDKGILSDSMPLRLYYAYGIRNSFGLNFDPITGFLWDTENGPQDGDEINLVEPGFNSGWNKIYGFSSSQKKF